MNFFRKFGSFLYWVWYDYQHPKKKRPYGITCYIGLPGKGKTLSLVEKLITLRRQFPRAKIYTNFGFKGEHGRLTDWHDFITLENGDNGIIFGIDEVQDIFNRKDWQSMPPAILAVFAQNRKHAKQFICTSQSYADVVVDLRRRCHLIIECNNIANRWIIQQGFHPEDFKEFDGTRSVRKRAFRYSFIATNPIYDAYDTYAIINSIRDEISQTGQK